jgi:hypothetical protein
MESSFGMMAVMGLLYKMWLARQIACRKALPTVHHTWIGDCCRAGIPDSTPSLS